MTTTTADPVKSKKILEFSPSDGTQPRTLTSAQVGAYNAQGYLAPLDVFSAEEASTNRKFLDRLMARAEAYGWDRYSLVSWESVSDSIYGFVTNRRILAIVEDLLGPNFLCVGTHFFCKAPGDEKRVTWHQDAPYYQLSPSRSVTAWLAIDDVDEENGAMKVIPRSHLHGEIKMRPSDKSEQNVLTHTVLSPETYGDPPISLKLRAGQISLHSDLVLHGSEPNPSQRRRCGLAIRYLPVDVRALTDWNLHSIICLGADPTGHWANNPRPQGDRVPIRPSNNGNVWQATETVPLDGPDPCGKED
jgi:non-heme Fe2+,alpha-ketoglutarate-dependent halogenase